MENKVKFDLSAFEKLAKQGNAELVAALDKGLSWDAALKVLEKNASSTYNATCELMQDINNAFMPLHSKAAPHVCAALRMILDSHIDTLDAAGKELYESELKLLQNNTKTIRVEMPEGVKSNDRSEQEND